MSYPVNSPSARVLYTKDIYGLIADKVAPSTPLIKLLSLLFWDMYLYEVSGYADIA